MIAEAFWVIGMFVTYYLLLRRWVQCNWDDLRDLPAAVFSAIFAIFWPWALLYLIVTRYMALEQHQAEMAKRHRERAALELKTAEIYRDAAEAKLRTARAMSEAERRS